MRTSQQLRKPPHQGHTNPPAKGSRKEAAPLTQKELAQISQEIAEHFFAPPFERETKMALMVVNPYCVYVYWSLAVKDFARFRQRLRANKHTHLVLRFYDLTDSSVPVPSSFDINLSEKSNDKYVDLWADNKCYRVELGVKDRAGRFRALARSNRVVTPRARPIEPIAPTESLGDPATQPSLPGQQATPAQHLMARHFPPQE